MVSIVQAEKNIEQKEHLAKPPEQLQLDVKITSVWERLIHTHLLWITIISAVIITAAVVIITVPTGLSALVSAMALAVLAIIGLLTLTLDKKRIGYEISLTYNVVVNERLLKKRKWWNQYDEKLYLGALPLKTKNHHKTIPEKLKVKAVLSVVEYFENHAVALLTEPVTPEDWKKLGIAHKQILSQDYRPVTLKDLNAGADFIHEHLIKGEIVYVHCKAGRSRSAAMIAAYEIKYKNQRDLKGLIVKIRKVRPHVTLGSGKREVLQEMIDTLGR